jgi:hypothetical protein
MSCQVAPLWIVYLKAIHSRDSPIHVSSRSLRLFFSLEVENLDVARLRRGIDLVGQTPVQDLRLARRGVTGRGTILASESLKDRFPDVSDTLSPSDARFRP